MRIKKWVQRHLEFSARERLSFFLLMTILILAIGLNLQWHFMGGHSTPPPPQAIQHISPTTGQINIPAEGSSGAHLPQQPLQQAYLNAGISEKGASVLVKYQAAGGRIETRKDAYKLKGISEADRLLLMQLLPEEATYSTTYSDHRDPEPHPASPQQPLVPFNPNTATESDWIAAGLKPHTAAAIVKYVAKGGRFKKPEDLLKMYTLQAEDLEKIKPYLLFESTTTGTNFAQTNTGNLHNYTATGSAWMHLATVAQLQHCGMSYQGAQQVINYRDRLGGLHHPNQFAEVKGLDSADLMILQSCVQIDPTQVKKLRINSAGFNDLANHPYLSEKFARAIVHYRDSTGRYTSLQELSKAYYVSPQYLEKLKHYLTL